MTEINNIVEQLLEAEMLDQQSWKDLCESAAHKLEDLYKKVKELEANSFSGHDMADQAAKAFREGVKSTPRSLPSNWLEICLEEVQRGKLTSHPRKFEFAKERGMKDLEEVHEWMYQTRTNFVNMVELAVVGALKEKG